MHFYPTHAGVELAPFSRLYAGHGHFDLQRRRPRAPRTRSAWLLQRSLSVMHERDALQDSLAAIGGVERGKRGDELIEK